MFIGTRAAFDFSKPINGRQNIALLTELMFFLCISVL